MSSRFQKHIYVSKEQYSTGISSNVLVSSCVINEPSSFSGAPCWRYVEQRYVEAKQVNQDDFLPVVASLAVALVYFFM